MISEIQIQNFKSIRDLTLKPGRVTVLIGENGSGKSNILEAIAFAAGASANKLDDVLLRYRGIRVTDWKWMQSAFEEKPGGISPIPATPQMSFFFKESGKGQTIRYTVKPMQSVKSLDFEGWYVSNPATDEDEVRAKSLITAEKKNEILEYIRRALVDSAPENEREKEAASFANYGETVAISLFADQLQEKQNESLALATGLREFLIYGPESTVLRTPPPEGATQPLGTKGEGLLRLLQSFTDEEHRRRLLDLQERLHLFGWFDEFLPPDDVATAEARLQIKDKWLARDRAIFDQRSANEGFLYVLFYLTLLMSEKTPAFFSLDNVDNALNPKLCCELMKQLVELAKKYDKQIICTTHNPSLLDGLDLTDEEQRLFAVRRDSEGHTLVNRVRAPKPLPGQSPVKLSSAFLDGYLGGLPENF